MVSRQQANLPDGPSDGQGKASSQPQGPPSIALPPRVPQQRHRLAQAGIPNDKPVRDLLRRIAAQHVRRQNVVPPLRLDELEAHAGQVLELAGVKRIYRDYVAIVVNNAAWWDTLARIPYDRRLLLLPKCLRAEGHCPASFDEFGLLCKECGSCSIQYLKMEAERLGYVVLVAEGAAVVTKMIETGRIEGIVGVSCMNVLEKCFGHMEARAVPGLAVPLLQDGCVNTTVDLDWVRDMIHLTSLDRSYRLDLDALKRDVQGWFTTKSLAAILGPPHGETEEIARDWLARAGKRWRPYLTACVYLALQSGRGDQALSVGHDLRKLAVAVECFHKASLIHDDIEDDDEQRYGERAMHVEHGMPVALNVGDFLLGEGYRLIAELEVAPEVKVEMLRTAANGHRTLSRGQGAELCWARRPAPLSSLEVLDIFRQKTAPAFEVALRLGAHYANVDRQVHDVLSQYSESLGIAYQIRDDLEDFSGQSDSHDLRSLRPSLIMAIAHKRAAPGAQTGLITSLWNRTCAYDDVADDVERIIEDHSVTDKAQELLEAYRQQATRSLGLLKNPTLKGLLRRVIGRIFGEDVVQGYCRELEAGNAAGGGASAEPAA